MFTKTNIKTLALLSAFLYTNTHGFDIENEIIVQNPCGTYYDVEKTDFICSIITNLKSEEILTPQDDFLPQKNISRAELLGIILKSAKIPAIFYPEYTYEDLKSSQWWAPSVSTAKKLGLANKNNKNFFPLKDITRAEAIQIIMKTKGIKLSFDSKYTYEDLKSFQWWAPSVSTAKKLGYISPTNKNFHPDSPISRQEAVIIVYNVFFK